MTTPQSTVTIIPKPRKPLPTSSAIFWWHSLKTRVTLTTLVFFAISIWSLALYTSFTLKNDMEQALGEQQFSTVSIIAAEINTGLSDRMRALERVAKLITPGMLGDAASMQTFLEVRPILPMMFNGGVFVLLPDGTAIADSPLSTGRRGLNFIDRKYAIGALKGGKTTIGSPVMGKALRSTVFSIATPIHDAQGKVIGALSGTVDLAEPNFISRSTDNSYGKTGGFLLVSPKIRTIVYATDKKRIMELLPPPGVNPLIDRFIQGYDGTGITIRPGDGVEILTSAKSIPVSGWYAVALMPTEEAFAPINSLQKRGLMAAIILTLLAGGLTWWMLKRQLAPILTTIKTLASLSDTDQPPQFLPVARQDEIGELIGSFNNLLETLMQREKTLRESGEWHRTILQTAIDGFWLTDLQGHLLEVNDAYCLMSGYSEKELLSICISDLESIEMAEDTFTHIQKIITQGMDRFESRHRRKDGSFFDIEASVQFRPNYGDGQLVAFVRDITERKQAVETLFKSEAKYRQLINNIPDIIYSFDLEQGGAYYSPVTQPVLGYSPEYLLEHPKCWHDSIHPDDLPKVESAIENFKTGVPFDLEYRFQHADGHWIWLNDRSTNQPAVINDGTRIEGIVKSITASKKAEDEKRKLESQLMQAQKMESVGRLAGGVAHDFNNLLTVILGGAHLALSELEPGQRLHEYVTQIQKAGEKSADLTQQLLAFARKQTIEPKVLDLNEIVSGMIKMLQRLIGENTQLTLQLANNLWPVKVDPSQIDQILANLCVNARDSIADIGTITIQTGNSFVDEGYRVEHAYVVPGEYVHISVRDSGCGMDKETMAHIFEPFFTTKGVGEGTGLGLAMVYGAAKQNNGFVNVYSEPGIGTTFTIYLPRYVGNTGQNSAKDQAQPAPRGLETILLVEDEAAILSMVKMLLSKQSYTVLAANTPGEATRLLNEHSGKIDLLITRPGG